MYILEDMNQYSLNALRSIAPYLGAFAMLIISILYWKHRIKFGNLKLGSRKRACGIIFGVILTCRGPKVIYSPIRYEGSVFIWGTSGSAKTSGILKGTINSLGDKATTFVIDISGDITKSANMRKKIVFGPNAENSACYNVFAPVDAIYNSESLSQTARKARAIGQLKKIASQMIPIMQHGDAQDAVVYYNNGAHDILAATLIAGYFNGLDFAEICSTIYKHSWRNHFKWIEECNIEEAYDLLGQFENIKEDNVAGCMGNAKNIVEGIASNHFSLQFLHRPKTDENGKLEPYFTPSMLETHSVFYVVNDGADFDLYQSLTRLVVSQTMEYLESRKVTKRSRTILLTLDEFSSLGMAKPVSEAAKKYRKRRVRLLVLAQSIADLDLMTNDGNTASRATIDNFPYRAVLGAQDPQSQKYFADCVGRHNVFYKDSLGNVDKRPVREYWIQPEEFSRLNQHLVLIHPDGHMVLGKNFYHKSTFKIILDSIADFSIFKWGVYSEI